MRVIYNKIIHIPKKETFVDVGANKLSIYARDYNNPSAEPKHFKDYTVRRIWIGDDTLKFGRKIGWTPSMKGNSILAQLPGGKMLYIGSQIYEFSMLPGDEPVTYSSYVGNSDVPYPFLVGKKHTYLMIEHVTIPNEHLAAKKDPYELYYGFEGDTEAKAHAKPLKKKVVHKRIL